MDRAAIEDFYPLSPMQKGMLFHSLMAPESGVYVEQSSLVIRGELDVAAFKHSWEHIMRRHAILRTAFIAGEAKQPVQVVQRNLPVPIQELDWRDRPSGIEALLTEERRIAFKLSEAPLFRLVLARTSDDAYTFVWTYHHALLDGWSVPLVLSEILQCYEAFRTGRQPQLPPVRPYRDYISWLHRQDAAKAERFWRQYLEGFTSPTSLAIDVPARDPGESKSVSMVLPEQAKVGLTRLSKVHGVTINTLVQAAWAIVLSRYSGSDDVVFGMTVSGRSTELTGADRMAGLFINTLPVRVRMNSAESVRDLLQRLQADVLEVREFEYSPLLEIQALSQVPRGTPLFNSIVVFESYPLPTAGSGPMRIEQGHSIASTNFPLALVAMPSQSLALEIVFDGQRVLPEAAERMLGHLGEVLNSIAIDIDRPVASVALLTEPERKLLSRWNPPPADFSIDRRLHELFEAQAAKTPDGVAVSHGDRQITYRELDDRANAVAAELRSHGVGPENPVGLFAERSVEMLVGLLGILKAGGAYVPLDPAYPRERLKFMIRDSGMGIVLAQLLIAASVPVSPDMLVLPIEGILTKAAAKVSRRAADPANLAYVIYTSGSTGTPKGVLIQHRSICNFALSITRSFGLGPGDRVLQFFSSSFDGAVLEIVAALVSGATLCLVDQETRLGPAFAQWLDDQKITFTILPPSFLASLQWAPLPKLRVLISGAEACPVELVERWKPGRRFVNAYGPTETTISPMMFDVVEGSYPDGVPIGAGPLPNTSIRILDRDLRPVPQGVMGELYAGGECLARGYLNRPDATAEKFIPDPFGPPGSRMYRTGDLARYGDDGNILFAGRSDHQVKIRGFRIEPREIETVLETHPAVSKAVVLAVGENSSKRLVAYFVDRPGAGSSERDLKLHLEAALPQHMVPGRFVRLDQFPLTPNGKIDAAALESTARGLPTPARTYVAPRTKDEETMAAIWSQVLGVERVGVYDNFFELGGDSILSIQVVARSNRAGIPIRVRQLIESPTIAELVAVAATTPAVQPVPMDPGLFALTPVQRAFFEETAEPDLRHFNTSMMVNVKYSLDTARLERAVQRVARHHDALRLQFVHAASGWFQKHASPEELSAAFIYRDYSTLSAIGRTTALEDECASIQASFDLTKGPLFRVVFFDYGGHKGRLLIVFHHLVNDAVSWGIFAEDLMFAYAKQGSPLPAATGSYQQWTKALSEYAESPQLQGEKPYWLQLDSAPVPDLPVDHPGGANTYGSTDNVTHFLNKSETDALMQGFSAALGVHTEEVLVTCLLNTLSEWTGSRKQLIGMLGHGREDLFEQVTVSRTLGWFVAQYPMLLDLGATEGLVDQMLSVGKQMRGVPNHGFGYGVLRYLTRDPGVGRIPTPRVIFNYESVFDLLDTPGPTAGRLPMKLAEESKGPDQSPTAARKNVLEVIAVVTGGELGIRWIYSRNLHDRSTVERLANAYLLELRRALRACVYSNQGA